MALRTPAEQTIENPIGLLDSKEPIKPGSGVWFLKGQVRKAIKCQCATNPCDIRVIDARGDEKIDRGRVAEFSESENRAAIFDGILNQVDLSTFDANNFVDLACQECRRSTAGLFEDGVVFPMPAGN